MKQLWQKHSKGRFLYYLYYFLAIFVIFVWATTFVSSKVVLEYTSPTMLMLARFGIAYIGLFLVSPKPVFPKSLKDELIFLILGLSGGTLYYLAENNALLYSNAGNVSLLVSTAPVLTALLAHFFTPHKLNKNIIIGFLVAFTGVFLIIYDGTLQLRALGDILAVLSALCWAVYAIVMTKVDKRYPNLVITRRIFLYSILTLLPVMLFTDRNLDFAVFLKPAVILNVLFLGIVASAVCYLAWNVVMREIGVVKANNFIYLIPLITILVSAAVLGEHLTALILIGGVLVLAGVFISEHTTHITGHRKVKIIEKNNTKEQE